MYKLTIVEDECDVRNRLVSMIRKSGSRFEIISEYETGIDAYDGIISDSPDLILTDIRIPYINGIELVKMVRDVQPLVKIIIITGYNEFDYAKEAANLGVVGFISKPITLEDMKELLEKAEKALDNEFLTASNLDRLSDFYKNSLPVIRENDLYRLSNMSEVPPSFENKLRGNGIRLDYSCFIMCIFDFDKIPEGDMERYDLVFSSIRESIAGDFCEVYDFDLFNRHEKLCLILKSNVLPTVKELERQMERIIQRAGRYSDMPVSVGISNIYEHNRNFAAMVKEAMRALAYRSIVGGQKIFFYGESNPPVSRITVEENRIRELGYMLRFQSVEDCIGRIDQIMDSLSCTGDSLYYTATSILNILIRACDDLESLNIPFEGPDSLHRRLFESKTDAEVCEYLKSLVPVIRQINDSVIMDNAEHNLRRVISYMETHFCEPDISFDSLAREVNFSVSYISALLKKNLNLSFVKMLTGLRIEKAKELLANPSLKIIDIAEQLGYNDSYYFSHCFKKYVGISPKEFRNNEQIKQSL